jgi:hypothetical protein
MSQRLRAWKPAIQQAWQSEQQELLVNYQRVEKQTETWIGKTGGDLIQVAHATTCLSVGLNCRAIRLVASKKMCRPGCARL